MPDQPAQRLALGVAYRGGAYQGWQSQPHGRTVQDRLEAALAAFAAQPLRTVCAGRTDAGVHALNQVVHLDAPVARDAFAWVRGTNRYLERDIALQWCVPVDSGFDARRSALGRRYAYLLLESPVRPAIEQGACGWSFRPLDGDAMRAAAALLLGEHDFSSFRAAECQAATPVKTLHRIGITRRGAYWRVDFDGNGHVDLRHSVPDVLASTANLLRTNGWQTGQPFGLGSKNFEVMREWNRSEVYRRTLHYFAQQLGSRG